DPPQNVFVAMHRSRDASSAWLEMQITMSDLVKLKSDDAEEHAKPIEEMRMESVLLDPFPVTDQQTIVLIGPRDQPLLKSRAMALTLEIDRGDDSLSQQS